MSGTKKGIKNKEVEEPNPEREKDQEWVGKPKEKKKGNLPSEKQDISPWKASLLLPKGKGDHEVGSALAYRDKQKS